MSSFFRIIKFSFQDIFRNLGLSLMTVFVLMLMLLSLNALWSVDVVARQAVQAVKGQVNMSIFLRSKISDKNIAELQAYLRSFPLVTGVSLLSQQQALAAFKGRYQRQPEVLDALTELGENPFGPTLVVTAREPEQYKQILQALSVPEYDKLIEAKSYDEHQDAIERIQTITNRIEGFGYGLLAFFSIIAFLIIFNTIRVAIYTQRMEISIKRLVGANNWFIQGPYQVSALIFSFVSIALTMAIVWFGLRYIDPYVSEAFSSGFSLTNYYRSHILGLLGVQALMVVVLTVVSSTVAMRRQLKV